MSSPIELRFRRKNESISSDGSDPLGGDASGCSTAERGILRGRRITVTPPDVNTPVRSAQ
jgi:hypothetical protein